jgi:hypothetical protein
VASVVSAYGVIIVIMLVALSRKGATATPAQDSDPPPIGAQNPSYTSPVDRDNNRSDADGRACMHRIQQEARASTEIIEAVMTLTDASGRSRNRRATFYQKQRSPTCMARLIRFHSPPELAGAAVLSLENADREADWWIYVPTYHVTRRIPSRNRSEAFMGTDMSYEDLTDLRLDHYTFRLAGADTIEDIACRLLEAQPVESSGMSYSQYGRLVYWVEESRPLYRKAVLYGHDGAPIKEVRNSEAVMVGVTWRWTKTEVITLETNHRTLVYVKDRRIGVPIPDRVFTERALRRSG